MGAFFDTILDFFTNIYDWVCSLFESCFNYLTELCWDFYETTVGILVDYIPDLQVYVAYLDIIKPYLKLVNTFIAFDIGMFLFGAYIAFVLVFIYVKLIIKLCPFIG